MTLRDLLRCPASSAAFSQLVMGRFEQAALVVVCAVTLLKLLPAPAGPAGNWTAVPLVIPAPPPPPEVAGPAAQHAELRWPQAEEEEEATPSLATAYDQPLARPQPGAEGELSPEKEEEAVEAVVGGEAAEDAELQATTAESQLPAEPPAEPPIATAEPVSSAAEAAVPAPPGGCGDGSTTIFSRRVVTRNATLSAVVVARHGVIVSVTPADAPPPGALDCAQQPTRRGRPSAVR